MKFKLPAFLENVENPVEGEVALRKFIAGTVGDAGSTGKSKSQTLDLLRQRKAREPISLWV